MVFNTTFNNISDISWGSVLLVEENGLPVENHTITTTTPSNIFVNKQFFY